MQEVMNFKNQDSVIKLTEEYFLGKGVHKTAYIHPLNDKLCIKIPFNLPDVDIEKELSYRKALQLKNKSLVLLPKYYGKINTNIGEGFVFERIVDYDGKSGAELKKVMKKMNIQEQYGVSAMEFMKKFRTMMLADKIVVSDVDPLNFMVMRTSSKEFTFKVVDNIGTPVFLPLVYYFDFVAERRIKKYWNRFIDRCKREYAYFLTTREWDTLYV